MEKKSFDEGGKKHFWFFTTVILFRWFLQGKIFQKLSPAGRDWIEPPHFIPLRNNNTRQNVALNFLTKTHVNLIFLGKVSRTLKLQSINSEREHEGSVIAGTSAWFSWLFGCNHAATWKVICSFKTRSYLRTSFYLLFDVEWCFEVANDGGRKKNVFNSLQLVFIIRRRVNSDFLSLSSFCQPLLSYQPSPQSTHYSITPPTTKQPPFH